jgi:hypothetical protein
MEPLPLGELSSTPLAFGPAWFVVMALILPAIVWLAFAWRRALVQDPNHTRRTGIRELRRLLKSVRRSQGTAQPPHLHAWFRATAKTCGVRVSTPTDTQISQSLHLITGDANARSRWRELWRATERSVFSTDTTPPGDWLERASAAAESIEIPKRARKVPNRIADWLPSTALTVMVVLACGFPAGGRADAPGDALGDALEPSTRALESNWNDWGAHYNLAALGAANGEWNTAVAHAAAAFLQNPSSVPARDVLRLSLEKSGASDPNLKRLLSDVWYERIPAYISAAGWQRVALVAAGVLAATLILMVSTLYVPIRIRGGFALAGLSTAVLITALVSWNAYGIANQPSAAVLVRAVDMSPAPTDLVTRQETSPVAAGTVVLTRRTFLGWQQIEVNPETLGWVRRNAIMPLYASRT